jgi:hypothetical protein
MNAFLARLSATFVIFCGVLFVYGFLIVDTIKVSTREFRDTGFDVLTTLPSITPRYARVQVFGCAAEITQDAVVRCIDGGWDTLSDTPIRMDVRQYPFPWGRYVPRGTILIVAAAYDFNGDVLARGRTVVMR